MAEVTKYTPISNCTIISDLKSHFSTRRTKKTVSLAYGFVFIFIAFTTFLAFTPSSNSSSPWFTHILSTTTSSTFVGSSLLPLTVRNQSNDGEKTRKNHALKPTNGAQMPFLDQTVDNVKIPPKSSSGLTKGSLDFNQNQTRAENFHNKVGVLKPGLLPSVNKTVNNNRIPPKPSPECCKGSSEFNQNQTQSEKGGALKANPNQSIIGITKSASRMKNVIANGEKVTGKNLTSSVVMKKGNDTNVAKEKQGKFANVAKKKQGNGTNVAKEKQGNDDLIKSLMNCDLFDGNWVKDESYPLYKPGSCSLIDEQFNCFLNGRPDNGYHKLKWKPKGCSLPRLDGSHMLELLRGKRLVFVGDSLNRNMWESLVCILKNSVKDQKKVYEEFGRYKFRTQASYSFVFADYNATVEFFVSPFLVEEWETTHKNGTKKETLRLDLISSLTDKYRNADIIVFNTGHWWTHEKTSLGKDYYQEGSNVYSELNVLEAFRKALTTWGRWVDANVNPMKSLVFFRGFSAAHFSGGQWNSGGQCDNQTEPIKEEKYLTGYPPKMTVLEKVLRGMKTHVTYLNVTKMTDYRKDGHPSIYRKQQYSDEEKRSPLSFQDCSHWCLPGVPDAWNEILYAQVLVKLYHKQH